MKREEAELHPQDEALEANVERLLRSAEAPPRIGAEARARVLGVLHARQAALRPRAAAASTRWAALRMTRGRAAALGGALALAAGALLWAGRSDAPAALVRYENAGPGPRHVVLSDGSRATLDVGAVLEERSRADLKLVQGQAVFDVDPGSKSFAVATQVGGAQVVGALAMGTRFWVRSSAQDAAVAVLKGRVELASSSGQRQLIQPGEQGVLRGDDPPAMGAAPRLSHVFGFARSTDVEEPLDAPLRKGTLRGRDPRGQRDEPLEVREFALDVHVEDGFARTTIDQTYFNPRSRQLEGIYAFPVPHGAALSRLAMYVDGDLMEGSIVERSRGRDIYEGIVEQRRDPALLEWMSGNTFRMRIFPLPARSEKRIFLSYTQPLEHLYGQDRLVVPIPTVDQKAERARFTVRVVDGGQVEIASPSHVLTTRQEGADQLVTFEAEDYALGQDLVLTMRDPRQREPARSFVDGSERFVMVRHAPDLRASAPRKDAPRAARRIAILFDVSASRSAQDIASSARFVDGLLDVFDGEDEVAIVTVGHDAKVMPGGVLPARSVDRRRVSAFLRGEGDGIGDSRLDLGLAAAVRELDGAGGEREVIYVGDGVFVGQGATPEAGGTARELARILEQGRARFLGVGLGESLDQGLLGALADATDGLSITVGEGEDLAHRALDLVASTYTPCLSKLQAEVVAEDGRRVEGALAELAAARVCDGERVEVIARLPSAAPGKARVRVSGTLGAAAWSEELPLAEAREGAGYLPRTFAERRVASLLRGEPPGPGRAESPNAAEITALARKHFLVTPFTSLLVLENAAMYKEFGVEKKKAEGWALYGAPDKIAVKHEPLGTGRVRGADWDILERTPNPLFEGDQQIGLGWIGLSGIGAGGGGSGTGRGFGAGSGRLGGRHSERSDSRRLSTSSFLDEPKLRRTVASASARPMAQDLASNGDLQNASPARREAARGPMPVSKQTDDWMSSAYGGLQIAGYGSSYDRQLDDLTDLVPSLFTFDFDRAEDALASGVAQAPPPSTQALGLLGGAAATRLTGSFAADDGRLLTLGEGGRVDSTLTLPTALLERAVYDGRELAFSYPELGLRTRRQVGPAAIWWLLRTAPMVVPPLEALAGLTLESTGERSVRVRLPQAPNASEPSALEALEIELDAQRRVTKLTRVLGRRRSVTTIAYEGANIVVSEGKQVTTFVPVARPAAAAEGELIDVEMPLKNPRVWLDLLEKAPSAADAEHAERQLLATYAALRDEGSLSTHLEALEKRAGKLRRGDVVLASAALPRRDVSMKRLAALPKGDPVRAYVEASATSYEGRPAALGKLGDKLKGSHLGMLASYRGLIASTDGMNRHRGFIDEIRRFHATYPQARFFRFALVRYAAQREAWDQKGRALAIYDTLQADPDLGPIADRLAIDLMAYDSSLASDAADRAVRSFDAALERGFPFALDWRWQNVVIAGRGQVGFDLLMARWRAKVIESGTARQVHALVLGSFDAQNRRGGAAQQRPDFGALLRRLDAAEDTDEDIRLQIAQLLVGAGHAPEAKQALAPLTDRAEPSVRALELAAVVAETEGDLAFAAALLDRVLRATQDEAIDLYAVRSWYSRLLALHFRRAGLSGGPGAADTAIRDALAVASRWRHEDADNMSIDEACAASLFRLGRDEEARRHLSSIVERRPAEGVAWGKVAEILQQQGDLAGAMLAWQDATRVEPTNPTWLLRRAEGLLIRAKNDDREVATQLLEKISSGKWQDRYANVSGDAGRLLPIARQKPGPRP